MKKKVLSMVVILSVVAFAASFSIAGGPAPEKGSAQAGKGEPVLTRGKILFVVAVNQYFVRGEGPYNELIVVNPNPKILDPLSKSGKIVTIQGYLKGGADLLFVEKIDGKPYRGEGPK